MRAAALAVLLAVACSAFPLADVLAPNPTGKNWAVLVAGSNSWGNYRHQADICHSYQVLVNHGFDTNNIIVMMYDDIANNAENPTKGVVINWPNGKDVYKGVSKDYTGAEVTPANFLKVLKGQSEELKGVGSGKVLNSGPNDNVFVFFSDHGGPGIIAFPSELLQATDLNNALQYMHTNKKYAKLVFYLEACESGSMFDTLLPKNINIFATTASDPTTSSWACYYDATRNTYLGDVYSVNWMEDSDMADLSKETLQDQFTVVKKWTNTSEVCEYGDMTWNTDVVADFQGGAKSAQAPKARRLPDPNADAVDSRDVAIAILQHRIKASTNSAEQAKLVAELNTIYQERAAMENMYRHVVAAAAGEQTVTLHMTRRIAPTKANMPCLRDATATFNDKCFSYSQYDYGMKLASAFVSMCESGVTSESIVNAISTVCPTKGLYVSGVF